MKHQLYIYIIILLTLSSCSTIKIDESHQYKTKNHQSLGALAKKNNSVLKINSNAVAYPTYKKPIKVSASKVFFNSKISRQFLDASMHQNSNIKIDYSDTLNKKPYLVKLDLSDKALLLSQLNTPHNSAVFDFLKNNKDVGLITGLSFVSDKAIMDMIIESEHVYLSNFSDKNYHLNVTDVNGKTQIVSLAKPVILSYDIESLCWKQNKAFNVKLSGYKKSNSKCSKGSYITYKKAAKRINLFNL